MKFLIKAIILVIAFIFAVWVGYECDKFIYHLFIGPHSTVESGFRLLFKIAIVFFTFSFIAWAAFIFAGIVGIFVDAFFERKPKRK